MRSLFAFLFAASLGSVVLQQSQPPAKPADPHARHDAGEHHLLCAKACNDCELACGVCVKHCEGMLAQGKQDHVTSLTAAQDCATLCAAAAGVVSRSGPFADLACAACAEACKRCGEICGKSDSPVMKKCAEECRKCEQACRDMLKTTAHGR